MSITIKEILEMAMQKSASDVHLKAGIMPVIRRHGTLRPLAANLPVLSGEDIDQMALSIMDANQREIFERDREVDVGYGISGLGRFRFSIFKQRGTTRMVIRNIPHTVPNFVDLNLPEKVSELALLERGLVIVTGITGSGKSSTLAAMIDHINRNKNKHILTIEDPIEFLIRDRKSIITQRELGEDTRNHAKALRAALRQDPDVILIGEMRDRETIEIALLAAETGHLVFSTLHTLDAAETVNRIVASFDLYQQQQIRVQLSSVLAGVISQRLARKKDKTGFVPAVEILIGNERIRDLIMDPQKTREIRGAIEEGQDSWGMQSFDQSIMELLTKGLISFDEALKTCSNPEDFKIRFSGITALDGKKWAESKDHGKKVNEAWKELPEVELDMPGEITKLKIKKK
jgi:twitching motility protein PilT